MARNSIDHAENPLPRFRVLDLLDERLSRGPNSARLRRRLKRARSAVRAHRISPRDGCRVFGYAMIEESIASMDRLFGGLVRRRANGQ